MYIYHALIKALSTHMIHINLNMIFYTHVEHSPTKKTFFVHKVLYGKNKHTHTHTHTNTHTPHMHTHTHTHTHTCTPQWIQMCVTLICIIHHTCTHRGFSSLPVQTIFGVRTAPVYNLMHQHLITQLKSWTLAVIPLFIHTRILHTLVLGMGSIAPAAEVGLLLKSVKV